MRFFVLCLHDELIKKGWLLPSFFFLVKATTQEDEELFEEEFTPFGFVVILPILTNF
jgi:hypothetical protein